jgi:hypothetical protein
MKNNKYKKIKKVIWAGASSGVVTGMIIMGVTSPAVVEAVESPVPAYAESVKVPPMHMMRRWNSKSRALSLAENLGLNPDDVENELKSGKTLKQILQDNGIAPAELHKAFDGRKSQNKRMWKKNLNNVNNQL